jgi:HD-like signal output (HDOD) protein
LSPSASRPCALHEAEREVFGATHAGVAAYLLGLWGLPANIVEAVAFHHAPEKGHTEGFNALAAVHCANGLAHQFFDHDACGLRTAIDPAYLSGLGLQDRLAVWRAACGPESEEPPHSNPARGG